MIHVLATITVEAGKRDELLANFRKVMPKVHAEKGCVEYGPTIDADPGLPGQANVGPDSVVIIERWESIEDLKAHARAPHMAEYAASVKHLVKERKIQVLTTA